MGIASMYSTIKNFPYDMQEAVELLTYQNLTSTPYAPIQHVVIAGMGSSGLAATFVKNLVNDKLSIPLAVNQDYTLPAYVNTHTLLIAVSYSGNTQETLAAFQKGVQKKAHIVVVSTGGILQSEAQQQGIDILALPAKFSPRAAIIYTITQILFILSYYKLFNWNFISELASAIQVIQSAQPQIQTMAQQVADSIQGKIPVIYTTSAYEHVAIRLRQQLNENSKQLCWHQVIPEFNHNEIVGWESQYTNLMVMMLSGKLEDQRLQLQEKISQDMLKKRTHKLQIIKAAGNTHLICSMYLLHLSDWISFYLAQKKAVDPIAIRSINEVKAALYENP